MKASLFHFFSKFSTELLLLEGLAILFLTTLYAGFYVLRRRRLGHIENDVPSGIVKAYLNQLIGEAELMRAQLFGLLHGAQPQTAGGAFAGKSVDTAALLATLQARGDQASDPALLEKVQALEAKMNEQNQNLQSVVSEKERIEKELAALKLAGGTTLGGASADETLNEDGTSPAEFAELQAKLENLESKLAEYSIIEDDLANLKRLQQENAQLRSSLSGQEPALEAEAEPVLEAAPEAETVLEAAAPPEEVLAQADAGASDPEAEAAFDGLVDQVEQSLQPVLNEPVLNEPAAAQTSTTQSTEKSDADLVEEFEKMLNA